MTEPTDQTRNPPGRPPGKPLSEAEVEQRRAAAKLSTGPKTEEGKARSSRNAWKHGLNSAIHRGHFDAGVASLLGAMGKPCKTTCPMHPDNPNRTLPECTLVLNDATSAGGPCLDKEVYVQGFTALIDAMQGGSMEGMQGVLAREGAAMLQAINDLRREIADNGLMIYVPAISEDGKVITRADGSEVIAKIIPNPAFTMWQKALADLGVNFAEMLATPMAQTKAKVQGEAADAMQVILGGIFQRAGKALPAAPRKPSLEHDDGA